MTIRLILRKTFKSALLALAFVLGTATFFAASVPTASAANASLSISPNSGTFVVDSTFDVSVYLDTQGQSINTIELSIKYPPDKLQLVSSSTGKSIIGIWTSQPKFNNQTGVIELTGGVPGGINASRGLITTMTFRAKAVGSAVVKFDTSRVLLNDGNGTETVTQNYNSVFDLILPPPAGPIVVSETHPDQTKWYQNSTVVLRWGDEGGSNGFSYMISDRATDVPDEVSEGTKHDLVYKNLGEGRQYFHIRALRDGRWGGTTHYALNIDTSAPAEFGIDIAPAARSTRNQPVIQFATTDALSGMDHYELKIVPLSKPATQGSPTEQGQEFFIEAQSPYITNELELGNYDVIVRAFDKAGNIKEITQHMEIVTAIFSYVADQGIEFKSLFIIPWWLFWLLAALLFLILLFIGRRLHLWHRIVDRHHASGQMPNALKQQLDELQKYRAKYGKIGMVLLAITVSLMFGNVAQAEDEVLGPPLINTVSKNISNEEIFYVGGKSGASNAEVVLYLQNLKSAETLSEVVQSDKNGDWFYRHDSFLNAGTYLIWAQTKISDQLSPPSPQIQMSVEATAVQFGATRLSYASIYLILLVFVAIAFAILITYVLYHSYHGRRKHGLLMKQFRDTEESLRRGFAVLNRDMQAELELLKKVKVNQALSREEAAKEEQILKDLKELEQHLSKEIWDLEETESSGR